MTANEIREWHKTFEYADVTAEVAQARARIEIAAQLAELNETMRGLLAMLTEIRATQPDVLKIQLGDERGWLMELRKAEEMAESQLQRALESEREVEKLECRISSLSTSMKQYRPFAKCDSMQDVFNVYDSMEGRALAFEEREKVLVEAVNEAGFAVYLTDGGKTFIKVWNRNPTSGIPQG